MSVQIKGVGTIGGIDQGLNIVGVTTASNFKTGTSNVHSTGYECTNVNASGIITASSYRGDGSQLTGITGAIINNNADNRIITGSGTANTLEGESTLNYGSNMLTFSGSATPLSGTGHNYRMSLYKDGGSGYGYIDTVTNGSNSTGIRIRTYNNGTYNNVFENTTGDFTRFYTGGTERLRITSGGQIGINQSNPARALTVNALGTGASSRLLRLATQDNNTRFDFSFENTDFLTIQNGVNDSAILKLHKSGHVSKPAHPSFSAKGVGSTFTYFANNNAWYSLGDTVLTNTSYKNDQNFTTSHSFGMNRGVLSNGNSCFNADTTVFTAPVDGFYHFCISLYLRATNGGGTAHIGPWINNSNTNIYMYNGSDTTSGDLAYPPATRTIDVKLSAGDTFFWAVYAVGTDKFSIYQDYSYISGYLIG